MPGHGLLARAAARLAPAAALAARARGSRARVERLEATPLSLPLLGAKAILSIVYYEHPDAAREIGWDQECMGPRP
ncbi:MAG: hypothetical protein M5U28_09520 [Sandaracinaceae bacterium]|nr:hypothetical protein [Sandaracinaceae bacterium]